MQSQAKDELFSFRKYYHILLHEHLKAAFDIIHFFPTRVKLLGHIIETNTISPLKSRIDAIQKLQPPSNKKNARISWYVKFPK